MVNNITGHHLTKYDIRNSLWDDTYYVLVQFSKLPDEGTRSSLRAAGLELGTYLPENAYLATINADADFNFLEDQGIVSISSIPPVFKIDPLISTYPVSGLKDIEKVLAITYFPTANKNMVQAALKDLGALIVSRKFDDVPVIFIQPSAGILNAIAALPFITSINLQPITDRILNYKSIAIHGMSALLSPSGRQLSGKNITVGIGDNAEISSDVDFTGRLINRVFSVPSGHGMHTSGTVAGGGILDVKNHGMASRATIVSQWFSDIITNTPTYVADHNMIATNNSYTDADDGCPGEGVYDVNSNYADAQMMNYQTVLHVFSAGNDGTLACSPYPSSFGTVKTGWQSAKNVLTVGAINQLDYTIANFSSRGPVQDGRLKPEIVASGVNVFSDWTLNRYVNNSGTSMSGPIVTGATTLLNERYRQLNGGVTPKAALLKALMCNTAEDLGNPGPDFTFGFGMLNARRAVEALEGHQYFISNVAPSSFPINLPAGVRRLKVMLYWADPAAAINSASAIVNDLDLTVTTPVAGTVLPLILDATPANVNLNAVQGADHINNIEQVVIDNPAAGMYNLNVNAYSVPQGPQEYILTYQLDMNGVNVEYPFGGETLVPGETETIRWSAYGDENNSFSVDTSFNNGLTWGTINNSVSASARSLDWVVPNIVTNNALVRVRRNSSVYADQSHNNFMILGQPTLTASVPCEGFVKLDWSVTPITGATSYDIFQLNGDSMQVIGNTASTSYLVQGLNSSNTYWFGVGAKNNAVNGRRSVSKNIVPSSGTCSLSIFDNDFKAESIDAPVSGRQFTSGALSASETIKFTIKNLDNVASAGTYNLYYSINGNVPVMETSSVILPPLSTFQYSFLQTADLSMPGIYIIKAWVKNPGDTQFLDDTIMVSIKNLANPPLTLPNMDGFETTSNQEYTSNITGLNGDDKVDFRTNSTRGRARTFVNSGFALNGNRAITLDQFPYGTLVTDSIMMTYNIATYNSGNQLRLDYNYKNHGQANNPDNKVWIRGNDSAPWVLAYDLVANQGGLGQWKHAFININDVLDTVIPAQPMSTSFQVRFGQQGNTSANDANPILDQDDGYTFDDISLSEALNDVAITSVVSPSVSGCGMTGTQPVSVRIKNYSSTGFNNVPVYYRINGGSPVAELVPYLAPNSTLVYTFSNIASLAINADYSFDIWVKVSSDNYSSNDSILNYSFHTSPLVTSFPYLEGFENGDGNWYQKGFNSSWQWGTPAKSLINKAANGTKAWVTSLTGNYNNNELSYLYSPCFDLSGLTQPVLSFSHIYSIEDGCPCDYTWVEYSDNGGITWNRLGTNGTGTNWYNDPTGLNQWRTSFPKWHVASTDIPTNSSNVRFRIVMSSDAGFNLEGVGIDDIHIFDKASIYTGAPVLNTMQNVSGNNWIHFVSNGKRIASINPNGQSLGNTSVDVYPYVGPVRYQNNQYYLDRNVVIRPSIQPGSNVRLRLYFTDTEAKNLVNATGCTPCSKPVDPYELGITKYSGTSSEENGTLADDLTGSYLYILPANTDIIPYDNGYYAEFPVISFSEFWFNNGGAGGTQPLPISLLSFDALKQTAKVLLAWRTDNELNMARFSIERSPDGNSWSAIGTLPAFNRSVTNYYSLLDNQPFGGLNLYRLKMINIDGSFRYSPVRRVNFNNVAVDINIYPNPVTHDRIYISSSGSCSSADCYDATGKKVKSFMLQGTSNSLDLSGLSKGIYQLKIVTQNSIQNKKIVIQ